MRAKRRINLRCSLRTVFGVFICVGSLKASGQAAPSPPVPALTSEDVVHRLVEHNQERAKQLRCYTSHRKYHIVYHGFPHSLQAAMDVDADYNDSTKSFRIVSQSGSEVLIGHVLKKLLTSEQEAAAEQRRNALTPANYTFSLTGTTTEDGRTLFVLEVHPRIRSKFLYRGKIWVDAADYAVVRVEAEPAENPSFWIRNTEIHHQYTKLGEFWLPTKNITVTKVRFGGTATLTIDYQDYRFDDPRHNAQAAIRGEASAAGK